VGNKYYLSIQNFLSSSFLSKNEEVKLPVHRTIILIHILHRCGKWCVTLKEEYKYGVFEDMVLRAREEEPYKKVYNLHFLTDRTSDQSMQDGQGVVCKTSGGTKNSCNISVTAPQGTGVYSRIILKLFL
jgi:hypothetical protein